jgi:glucose-1-phosphate cytidylyltransferase
VKVAILAGGFGTRFAEETAYRPKPMIEIGGRPILWHIMMHYYAYGHTDFVVALGYKADVIKRWFVDMANSRATSASRRISAASSDPEEPA